MQAAALFFPVRDLPVPVRALVTALLLGAAAGIVYTTLGSRVEKSDERAAANDYRANSVLYECIFFLFAFFVLFGGRLGISELSLTRGEIILLFAVLNLLHDGVFLLYERFGK